MRFEPASFLLGLATLGNLPVGSARVLYGYTGNDDLVSPTHNVTNVERAVVVPPVKPPVKPGVHDAPEPIVPGGDKAPTTPGDTTPDSEPAPLVPTEKNPNAPGDKTPDEPLVPGDKTTTPAGDKDGATASDKDPDFDLWCPSEISVTKRALEARARDSCRRRRTDREGDELRSYLSERGRGGEDLLRSRRYATNDYDRRIDDYYDVDRDSSPEPSLRETFRSTDYDRQYGFEDTSDFQTYSTYAEGNADFPVVRASYGRSSRDPDHALYMSHWRFADQDANRFQLGRDGRPRYNEDDTYMMADNADTRAVPASHIYGRGARDSGVIGRRPRRLSLMSERVSHPESMRAFDDTFEELSGSRRGDGWINLRQDSTGLERANYERQMGVYNHRSNIDTIARDRDYADYEPVDIDLYRRDRTLDDGRRDRYYASSMNFERRDRRA